MMIAFVAVRNSLNFTNISSTTMLLDRLTTPATRERKEVKTSVDVVSHIFHVLSKHFLYSVSHFTHTPAGYLTCMAESINVSFKKCLKHCAESIKPTQLTKTAFSKNVMKTFLNVP